MSLAFLAKKSWHTTNIRNVERVWQAEEKAEEEKKKVAELMKQIAEERQINELRQMQVTAGHVIKVVDNTLDWMYEGPAAEKVKDKAAEDYLLGKTYQAKEEKTSDLHKIGETKAAGATWLNKTSNKNDMFTRLHEDPMLLIKQNEKKMLEQVLKNPLKMGRIRLALAAQQKDTDKDKKEKKDAKKAKKAAKKEKKSNDKKRAQSSSSRSASPVERPSDRRPDYDQVESRGDGRDRGGGNLRDRDSKGFRQRSRSQDRDDRRDDKRDSSRGDDGNRDSRRDDYRRGNDYDIGDRRGNGRERSREGERSRRRGGEGDRVMNDRREGSRDRSSRYNNRSRSRDRHGLKDSKAVARTDRNKSPSRREKRKNSEDLEVREKVSDDGDVKKYGLLGRKLKDESKNDNDNGDRTGPKLALLQKRAEENRLEIAARNKPRENVKQLSESEKQERLRQMEADARTNDDHRLQRISGGRSSHKVEKEEEKPQGEGEATFMKDMRTEVYVTNETTMEERLHQNKFYNQRGTDLDSSGFLKKK